MHSLVAFETIEAQINKPIRHQIFLFMGTKKIFVSFLYNIIIECELWLFIYHAVEINFIIII